MTIQKQIQERAFLEIYYLILKNNSKKTKLDITYTLLKIKTGSLVCYDPPIQTSESMRGICCHEFATDNLHTVLGRMKLLSYMLWFVQVTIPCSVSVEEHGSIIGGPPLENYQSVGRGMIRRNVMHGQYLSHVGGITVRH